MYRTLEDRLNRLPGVQGSGLALYNPLTDNWGEVILVAGHPPPKPGDDAGASWDRVSATYLQNLGMTMARGRAFTEADNDTTAPVAIVNEAFVKRFFKSDEDPIGQHFGLDEPENVGTFRIIGVVRDARFASFQLRRPPRPMFYVPLAQNVNYVNSVMTRVEFQSHFIGGILLRTTRPPGALEPLVTKALAEVDPNLTLMSVRTLEQQIALTFDQERAVASLAGLFGVVSLLLAAIGLYGVTAYSVAQRTNEIGIRMALGADRGAVLALVLRSAFMRVALGLVLGVPLGDRRRTTDCRAAVRRDVLGSRRPGRRRRIADGVRVRRGADSRQSRGLNSPDARAAIGITKGNRGMARGTSKDPYRWSHPTTAPIAPIDAPALTAQCHLASLRHDSAPRVTPSAAPIPKPMTPPIRAALPPCRAADPVVELAKAAVPTLQSGVIGSFLLRQVASGARKLSPTHAPGGVAVTWTALGADCIRS